MSEGQGRARGELEREVLACLAAAGTPLTAGEVLADLGGGLAYTTVMTTLARLNAKGVLTRRLAGRAHRYSLAGGPEAVDVSLTAHRMRRLLDAGPDRARVLARFVADLTPADEQLLAGLLGDAPSPRAEGGGPMGEGPMGEGPIGEGPMGEGRVGQGGLGDRR
jgi:predicted transcriptional regulator